MTLEDLPENQERIKWFLDHPTQYDVIPFSADPAKFDPGCNFSDEYYKVHTESPTDKNTKIVFGSACGGAVLAALVFRALSIPLLEFVFCAVAAIAFVVFVFLNAE